VRAEGDSERYYWQAATAETVAEQRELTLFRHVGRLRIKLVLEN
jgi:hypothetical protein